VETAEQLAYLAERACDVVQGYLFGRPVPADAAARVLAVGDVVASMAEFEPAAPAHAPRTA